MVLGKLVCGNIATPCVASTTLDQLCSSIDRFSEKAMVYLNGEFTDDAQSFGAFCARVILENTCAALVGRYDPFRLSYLSEFQTQGGFDYTKAAKSGFKWTGDVFTDESPTRELWHSDYDISKISRALFSGYVDHLYWKPAMENALVFLDGKGISDLHEIKRVEPNKFIKETKGKCSGLYSKLSKGVHWDFFAPSTLMDEVTLKDSIRDCFIQVSNMGFISHFAPTAYRSLSSDDALAIYTEFRETFA
ncbi:hypothetical protein ABNQ39_06860 [Azospirillum sp. A26]|uniref:hypothetical protein n=1 Tax=Azospirillum sp. A26 TaxID=3160607 RepID=UPI003672F16F